MIFLCFQEVLDTNLTVLIWNCLCTIFPELDIEIITKPCGKHANRGNIVTFDGFVCYGELNFGAAQGLNDLAMQNLVVIGNQIRVQVTGNTNGRFNYCWYSFCTMNRAQLFNFSFMTFSDDLLRKIQLYLILSKAEQAVCMALSVTHNCIVSLYSILSLEQFTLKWRYLSTLKAPIWVLSVISCTTTYNYTERVHFS